MIKRVFWLAILLGSIALPLSMQKPLSFVVSGGITAAIAAEEHEDRDHQQKKKVRDNHGEKDQNSFRTRADAYSKSKDREHPGENRGGAGNGADGVTLPPAPPAPTADIVPPVVVAPANVISEATGIMTPVTLGSATVTDNVDTGLVATPSNTGPFSLGATTVTWSATDAAGNTGTATQTVTVVDTTPPEISIHQPAITVEAVSAQVTVVLGIVTATDLVDGALVATNNAPAVFPMGVTQVVWSATDAAGNTVTATQNVVVQDTTPPLVTAPAAVTADSATGQPIAVAIGTATATDAFTPIAISSDAPATFPLGATTVTWTATDANGNSATATQIVTVNDASVLAGLPPDPGAAGMATLEGIDSDGDGVRDDVQRWIAMAYPNSQKVRAALTQAALTMQTFLMSANSPVAAYNSAIKMGKD